MLGSTWTATVFVTFILQWAGHCVRCSPERERLKDERTLLGDNAFKRPQELIVNVVNSTDNGTESITAEINNTIYNGAESIKAGINNTIYNGKESITVEINNTIYNGAESITAKINNTIYNGKESITAEVNNTVYNGAESVMDDVVELRPNDSVVAGPAEKPRWYELVPSVSSSEIFSYIPKTKWQSFRARYYSCDGLCGHFKDKRCSCLPSCIALKTCCLDFVELCVGTVYSMAEIESYLSLLQHVDKECIENNVVITSCPGDGLPLPERHSVSHANDTTQHDLNGIMASSSTPNVDLMRLLAQSSPDTGNLTLSTQMEWLLSSVVLDDTSTGVAFANASIFNCNGGLWAAARPWHVFIEYERKGDNSNIIFGRRVRTLESISAFVDLKRSVFKPVQYINWCNQDLISNCPENYLDEFIKGACEDTNLFIKTRNMLGDPASEQKFKNPFCQACHIGLNPLYLSNGLSITGNFISTLILNIGANSFLLRMLKISNDFLVTWKNITCNWSENKMAGQISGQNNVSVRGISEQVANTACDITSCYQGLVEALSPDEECSYYSYVALLLPPGSWALQREDLIQNVFKPFASRFSRFMGIWNIRFVQDSLMITLNSFDFYSREMQYSIASKIQSDLVFSKMDESLHWQDLPHVLWTETLFPFHNDSLYFCIVVSNYKIYSFRAKYYRCWDFVPKGRWAHVQGNLMDEGTTSGGQGRTTLLVFQWFLFVDFTMTFICMLFQQGAL